MNIGTFRAGDWPSIVPGWAELEGRISYLPSETEEKAKSELESALNEVMLGDEWLKIHPISF